MRDEVQYSMISRSNHTKRFCSEPLSHIENYEVAISYSEHLWDCHHRNEICEANRSRSDRGITPRKQLIADGMYYNRPASELIFLRHDVHRSLHHKGDFNKVYCSKPVEMTRLSDGYTREFPSMREAARWLRENGYPKADKAHIYGALKKNQHSCGAKWRFKE